MKKDKSNIKNKKKTNIRHQRVSIKLKLIVFSIFIAVVPMVIIAIISFTQAEKTLLTKVDASNTAYVEQAAMNVEMKLQDIDDLSMILATNDDLVRTLGKNEDDYDNPYNMTKERNDYITEVVMDLRIVNSSIQEIYFIQDDEIINYDQLADGDAFHEAFLASDIYTQIKEARNKPLWFYDLYETDHVFYIRELTSTITFESLGIMVVEADKDFLYEALETDELGEDTIISLISDSGYTVASSDETRVKMTSPIFGDIQTRVEAGEETNTFNISEGYDEEHHIIYQNVNDFYYTLEVPSSYIMGDIKQVQDFLVLLGAIVGVISIVIGVFISISITKPISYLRDKLKLLEQGQLNVRSEYEGSNEIGQLSHSFNAMASNMSHLISTISAVNNNISDSAKNLTDISITTANSSREVIQTLESVADGSVEQVTSISKSAEITKNLISQVGETESYFESVVIATNNTVEVTSEAESTVVGLSETTKDAMAMSKQIQVDVKDLVSRFMQINDIVGIIEGISKQTDLLSLNASIEAARAGEAGKGFGVVSNEIRLLAEQSGDAAKKISEMIGMMQQATKDTEKVIDDSLEIYERQEQAVSLTATKFEEITKNMSAILTEIDNASTVLEGLDGIQKKANEAMGNSVDISESAAAAVEELLASGEEQLASSDTLVEMSESLRKCIREMDEELTRFKV